MELQAVAQSFGALSAVLLLMWLVAFLVKRLDARGISHISKRSDRRLQVMEWLPIDVKRKALILRCDRREFLVLTSEQNSVSIAEITPIETEEISKMKTKK